MYIDYWSPWLLIIGFSIVPDKPFWSNTSFYQPINKKLELECRKKVCVFEELFDALCWAELFPAHWPLLVFNWTKNPKKNQSSK